MTGYTLGLFANMYPAFEGDYRGIFIRQMVRDLELRGISVRKAVKTTSSPLGYFPFYYESLRLSRSGELDLMQAEYIPHSSLVPALFGRRDVPLILKFHGDDARIYPFKNGLYHRITKAMIRRADYIIAGSEEMRRILIRLGATIERSAVVHTGVDTAFFTPGSREESRRVLGLSMDETVFLFVGRLHPWKGINEILDATKSSRDSRFVFVGPGTIPDHPGNCQFTGMKSAEEIRTWMQASDCLLLPTYTESVPAVVMEASACGIPSITSDVGGCPEIIEDGKNGLIVPVRDTRRLLEAVTWMKEHPDARQRMGDEARSIVCSRYDHNYLTDKLISIHTSLLPR